MTNKKNKIIKKSKKGFFLWDETGKILLSVFAIIILLAFSVKLFGIFSSANNEKTAEKVLENIALKLDYLQSSSYSLDEIEVLVSSPGIWALKNYDFSIQAPPKGECVGNFKKCLCLCERYIYDEDNKHYVCLSLYVCKGFKENLIVYGGAYLDEGEEIINLKKGLNQLSIIKDEQNKFLIYRKS